MARSPAASFRMLPIRSPHHDAATAAAEPCAEPDKGEAHRAEPIRTRPRLIIMSAIQQGIRHAGITVSPPAHRSNRGRATS
jgi:hypothetical protein